MRKRHVVGVVIGGLIVGGTFLNAGADGDTASPQSERASGSTTTWVSPSTTAEVRTRREVSSTTISPTPTTTAATPASTGVGVSSITDGDTFRASGIGAVRLAQVDAPETDECYGSESTAALRALIDGKTVELRKPTDGPSHDRYGRTLADVIVDGVSVNEALIAQGAAEWYESFASEDAALATRLEAAEAKARSAGLGLWSACAVAGGAQSFVGSTPPPPPPAVAPPPPPPSPALAPSSAGGCHPGYPDECIPPGPPDLDCGDVGHVVRVDHAFGDPHGFDADADGEGCESYG